MELIMEDNTLNDDFNVIHIGVDASFVYSMTFFIGALSN